MDRHLLIRDIYARQILDAKGTPALEVEVLAGEDTVGTASVSLAELPGTEGGAGYGERDQRYDKKRAAQAVENVNSSLAHVVIGMNVFDQERIDRALLKGRGSETGCTDGAALAISLASAYAASAALKLPLYRYLGGLSARELPVPMMKVLGGVVRAENLPDIRAVMLMPAEGGSFRRKLDVCTEVYHELKNVLRDRGMVTASGNDGSFAPAVSGAGDALRLIREAVERAGYRFGRDVGIALDAAASGLYDAGTGKYRFPEENGGQGRSVERTSKEMASYYEDLAAEFPIWSIEDPLGGEDWEGWQALTEKLGRQVRIVGEDLFRSDIQRLRKGIQRGAANTIAVRMDRAETLTRTAGVIREAQRAGYGVILSHSPKETADTAISDLAAAFHAGQIKCGAPCGAERTGKYNRLLQIEEKLE